MAYVRNKLSLHDFLREKLYRSMEYIDTLTIDPELLEKISMSDFFRESLLHDRESYLARIFQINVS